MLGPDTVCDRKEFRHISIFNHPGHHTIMGRMHSSGEIWGHFSLDRMDQRPGVLTVSKAFVRSLKSRYQSWYYSIHFVLQLSEGKDHVHCTSVLSETALTFRDLVTNDFV